MEALRTPADAPTDRALDPETADGRNWPAVRPFSISATTTRQVQERLGSAIRRRRRLMDMTLQDLAGSCNVTFQQIQKYECGSCSISAAQLWSIAVALEVPVSYFYDSLPVVDRARSFSQGGD